MSYDRRHFWHWKRNGICRKAEALTVANGMDTTSLVRVLCALLRMGLSALLAWDMIAWTLIDASGTVQSETAAPSELK